jgi:hypothetical protein
MMTISIKEMEREMPAFMERKIEQFMNRFLG